MYEWYLDLPSWIRGGIGLFLLILGILASLFFDARVGFVLIGLAVALLLVGGKSDAERNGYKF